ncbi:MAG: hypothetical protein GYA33_08260 [Thermogutta sp.]|nr:hypothetical protein [Thermogutta sp.]
MERPDPPHLRDTWGRAGSGHAGKDLVGVAAPVPPSPPIPLADSDAAANGASGENPAKSKPATEDALRETILLGERPASDSASSAGGAEGDPAKGDHLVLSAPHGAVASEVSGPEAMPAEPGGESPWAIGLETAPDDVLNLASQSDAATEGPGGLRLLAAGDAAPMQDPQAASPDHPDRLDHPASSTQSDDPDQSDQSEPLPEPAGDPELARRVKTPSRWTPPQALFDQLQGLADHAAVGNWVLKTRDDLEAVGRAFEDNDIAEVEAVLARLQRRLDEAAKLQADLAEGAEAAAFRQVRYALIRRMNLWKLTAAMGGLDRSMAALSEADWARLAERTAAVEDYLHAPEGGPWKEFLRAGPMRETFTKRSVSAEEDCREIAAATLRDVTTRDLAPDQRRFLDQPVLAAYLQELAFWREAAVTAGDLLRTVESYEQSGSPADAEAVMAAYYRLEPSSDQAAQAMARCLHVLYRNANVRVVVTADLLNRMMPERSPESRPVSDTILGRQVRGTSLANTTTYFRFLPDPRRARLALIVQGRVTSETWSQAGAATFFNDGFAVYDARKEIELTPQGIVARPAEIDVRNRVELRYVSTSLDPIPVLGFLAQEVARDQLAERRLAMNAEVKWKLASQVLAEIERESEGRFAEMNRKLETDVLSQLSRFSLGPTWIGAQTTEDRLVLRWRLGDAWQPGGHTLRPWAASDSLASLQVHESAINNCLLQFRLEGRTFALPDLEARLRDRLRLPQPDEEESAGARADATIAFASRNAAHVEFREGRLTVVLSVASLAAPPNRWEDFEVRAHYRPEVAEDRIQFVRDGVVQLIGPMDMRSQIALRGVFSKTFSKSRPWRISAGFLKQHPGLADLTITQLELENGWLGVAVGRRRTNAVASSGSASGF